MPPPPELRPRQRRSSVRSQARLEAETHATVEVLARTVRRQRAQILRHVRPWGLIHGTAWIIDPSMPAATHLVHMLVDTELLQQVQAAAAAHSASVAAWVRHALRQVTRADFPPSWQAGEAAPRSHDSQYYGKRFLMRLDAPTRTRLEELSRHFGQPVAAVIRQLVTQARVEDFPESWQLAVKEHQTREQRRAHEREPCATGAHQGWSRRVVVQGLGGPGVPQTQAARL
jgi:predicted DNA-binding protein